MKKGITRRQVLEGLGIALGAATLGVGCNDGSAAAGTGGGGDGDGPDAGLSPDLAASPDLARPVDASEPPDLAQPPDPKRLIGPIDTIVVLMMENRSFDHYYGARSLVEKGAVDGLAGNEWNPDPSGNQVAVHALETLTPADPPHDWDSCHNSFNNGANDGFVKAHAGADQNDVMGYYLREQLPISYALADEAALCQRWFASVMGPTWPNRFFLHAASSNGVTSNVPAIGLKSLFDVLDAAGISNRNYYSDVAWASGGYLKLDNLATLETFFQDAAAGTLPHFSIIDPMFFGAGANDDHPSHDVSLGQALISTVFAALAQSPQWDRLLFVLTYDEHGGFYDHVPPPLTTDERAEFQQLGFRVPALVAGPYVKRGVAIDTVFDHVSVASTVTLKWGLPPLNARVAATNDLTSCLDPALLKSPKPPPTLPPLPLRRGPIRNRPAYSGEHRELLDAIERGRIPRRFDRRREAAAITEHLLAEGVRLGAIRLID